MDVKTRALAQMDDLTKEMAAEISGLRAQRAELRRLLRPFLEQPHAPDTLRCYFCGIEVQGTGYHHDGCPVLRFSDLLGEYEA